MKSENLIHGIIERAVDEILLRVREIHGVGDFYQQKVVVRREVKAVVKAVVEECAKMVEDHPDTCPNLECLLCPPLAAEIRALATPEAAGGEREGR